MRRLVFLAVVVVPVSVAQDLFLPAKGAGGSASSIWARTNRSFHEWYEDLKASGSVVGSLPSERASDDLISTEHQTGATHNESRRLTGGSDERATVVVMVTIFGKLGREASDTFEQRVENAEGWLLAVFLEAVCKATRDETRVDIDASKMGDGVKYEPYVKYKVVDKFRQDDFYGEKDSRSPFTRTNFWIRIPYQKKKSAEKMVRNICGGFEDNQISTYLLAGLRRALEQAMLYPYEGEEAAAKVDQTNVWKQVFQISGYLENFDKPGEIRPGGEAFSCTEQVSDGVYGKLLLGQCPENAEKCETLRKSETYKELCKGSDKGHDCRCKFGYTGDISLPDVTDIKDRIEYQGKCKLKDTYCPLKNARGDKMYLKSKMDKGKKTPVKGHLGEKAVPGCNPGYFGQGWSNCVEENKKNGRWAPDAWCKWDPVNPPTAYKCPTPDNAKGSLSINNCDKCWAFTKWMMGDAACTCRVTCANGYKESPYKGEEGEKKCVDKPEGYPCPDVIFLQWIEKKSEGNRCRDIPPGKKKYPDFCCSEPWGTNLPQTLQKTSSCRKQKKDSDCLTRYEKAEGHARACCWRETGYLKDATPANQVFCVHKADENAGKAESCAVAPEVPYAEWEAFPKCKKTCSDVFSKDWTKYDIVGNCDECVPGEATSTDKKRGCYCEVRCKSHLMWFGGSPEGPQVCSSITSAFDAVPVCLAKEVVGGVSKPYCDPMKEESGLKIDGCGRCVAGDTSCKCDVNCEAPTHRLVKGTGGKKECQELAANLAPARCEDIMGKTQCLKSISNEPTRGGLSAAPCCYNSGGFGDGGAVKCVALGSNLIRSGQAPSECANMKKAEWEKPPKCSASCDNIFAGQYGVVEEDGSQCDTCVLDTDKDDCNCKIKCDDGFQHVGGGRIGKRKCKAVADGVSFGAIPICIKPPDGEDFLPGTMELKSKCELLYGGSSTGMIVTGCRRESDNSQCRGGDSREECPCDLSCMGEFKRRDSGGGAGPKRCLEESRDLTSTYDCDANSNDEEACLRSEQSTGMATSPVCCWNGGGFKREGGGKKCLAFKSEEMERAPQACAATKKANWETLPICDRKCPDIFTKFHNVEATEGCRDCTTLDGGDCNCEVNCKGSLIRVDGGFSDSTKRLCKMIKDEAAFDHPAPICVDKVTAGKDDVKCLPPLVNSKQQASLVFDECHGCTAVALGEEDPSCRCRVGCRDTYLDRTGVIKPRFKNDLKCTRIQKDLEKSKLCAEITDHWSCIRSADKKSNERCCWRASGFLNQPGEGAVKCAAIGSAHIGTYDSNKYGTHPDTCSAEYDYEWPALPECSPLCTNSFEGFQEFKASDECNNCFVDQDDCQCKVTCKAEFTFVATAEVQSEETPRKCLGSRSYGEPPRCVLFDKPPTPICHPPASKASLSIPVGCNSCVAMPNDEKCDDCKVTCAKGFQPLTGTVGPQMCRETKFDCPDEVEWLADKTLCVDKSKGEADEGYKTSIYCCHEAWPKDRVTECSSISNEAECLRSVTSAEGLPCCYREEGFSGSGEPKCEKKGSFGAYVADGCQDKPRVKDAKWDPFPTCEPECDDKFSPEKSTHHLRVEGCGTCVPSNPGACNCKVECESTDFEHIGGAALVPKRSCDLKSEYVAEFTGALPICFNKEEPPSCSPPLVTGASAHGNCNCVAGDSSCDCKVTCDNGFLDIALLDGASMPAKITCGEEPRDLKDEGRCEDIEDMRECLTRMEGTTDKRCCWRERGFFASGPPKRCVSKGHPDMVHKPDECAPTRQGVWSGLPTCGPKCKNPFEGPPFSDYLEFGDCSKCVADRDCPGCTVKCRSGVGYERVGGGQESGIRTLQCTDSNLYFTDPPVCKLESADPKCGTLGIENWYGSGMVVAPACALCTVAQACPKCTIQCDPKHKSTNGVDMVNRCEWKDTVGESKTCEEASEESDCLKRRTPGGGVACCFHQDGFDDPINVNAGPKCLPKGDARIKRVPKECTMLREPAWVSLPECARKCEHEFWKAQHVTFTPEDCSDCVSGMKAECKCTISCSGTTQRMGGGQLGARFCPHDSHADETWKMEDPPLCQPGPADAVCPPIRSPGWKATGCDNCVGGGPCNCKVSCDGGFGTVTGETEPRSITCMLRVDSPEYRMQKFQKIAKCGSITDSATCLKSYDGAGNLCCYRYRRFKNHNVCAAKGSAEITAALPPDNCAPSSEAYWEGEFPTCKPVCVNIFRNLANIDQANLFKCDNCVADGPCECEANCVGGTMPRSGTQGPKQCKDFEGYKGHKKKTGAHFLVPQFEPPPECSAYCQAPDDQKGRLDVRGCLEDTFVNVQGRCKVTCMKVASTRDQGIYRYLTTLRSGSEGFKECSLTAGGAKYFNLPDCQPICEPPSTQFNEMVVRGCVQCYAGDPISRCKCHVQCVHAGQPSGGVGGDKVCYFVEGNRDKAASGKWVNADEETWPDGSRPSATWDRMPSCLQALTIIVKDATTGLPLDGVTVEQLDANFPEGSGNQGQRVRKGNYEILTSDVEMLFKLSKSGYGDMQDTINRVQYCPDPKDCQIEFFLNPTLQSGELSRDGCYFLANPDTVEFKIRAVLSWQQFPKDLDLWMTKVECSENTRKRYMCYNDFDKEKIAAKKKRKGDEPVQYDNSCMRSEFSPYRDEFGDKGFEKHDKFDVRNRESASCRMMTCDEAQGRVTKELGGHPVCDQENPHYHQKRDKYIQGKGNKPDIEKAKGLHNNQFAKWIYWGARYIDRLHKEFDPASGTLENKDWRLVDAEGAEGWTPNNYAYLNVDRIDGFGPETITMVNPPPGTYQFVVDQFQGGSTGKFIKSGDPKIFVTLGSGNQAIFRCRMRPECPDESSIWNAFHIKIERTGETERGMLKFKVRLIMKKKDMNKVAADQLPTTSKPGKLLRHVASDELMSHPVYKQMVRLLQNAKMNGAVPIPEAYFTPSAGTNGQAYKEDQDLDPKPECHGVCVAAEGTSGFDDCLAS